MLNFDEAGFWVRVAPREEVVVPAYVKEVSSLIYINIIPILMYLVIYCNY